MVYRAWQCGQEVAASDNLIHLLHTLGPRDTEDGDGDGAVSLSLADGGRISIGWCPSCDAGSDEIAAVSGLGYADAIDTHQQYCDECRPEVP